ncbi:MULTISPECIES: histidinol dehydrogenase [Atopobiaceae]|uniref:Histidinol dehydrogenase n=1 Tax=Parafannyhessea umbonata TaxID=604330 RepID=A0A1H6K5D0_9ACTN|nr:MULTISPECIES: histidinol dehydrogenase [Atopobiaceae]SEH67005.1 histidinol dehydrogenase [Parafannyhessea umbonata]SJZ86638.1 histidinol dehydrogenase [Olsenella sp. KH1P3]
MRTVRLSAGQQLTKDELRREGALPREVMESAQAIVDAVREGGDQAVRDYCLKFDGACPQSFRVDESVIQGALDMVDPEFLAALNKAAAQIEEFHQREREESWFMTRPNGTVLGVKVTPVASAALYVPGGRAQYPSTVLMDSIPAKVAGVERVVMLTPPQRDGSLSAYTLAAAAVAGVDEVYAVGGAQAIAAAAYGTESIPAVEKIVGPGNAFVAAAKRYVSGDVGIDMVAGPSEVGILADATADPAVVAADLMAQAEHDPMAACYLVTCDEELPGRVLQAVEALVSQSPREKITRASLDDNGLIVVCDTLDEAIDAMNVVAPEHLELHCADAFSLVGKVRNAGAIFVGAWSSEPLGDYVAGPNHTLPTGGTARFSSPLGVYDFTKRSSVISYSPEGLRADGPAVQAMAQAEGLWAHALSVGMRMRLLDEGGQAFADSAKACEGAMECAWPRKLDEPGVPRL